MQTGAQRVHCVFAHYWFPKTNCTSPVAVIETWCTEWRRNGAATAGTERLGLLLAITCPCVFYKRKQKKWRNSKKYVLRWHFSRIHFWMILLRAECQQVALLQVVLLHLCMDQRAGRHVTYCGWEQCLWISLTKVETIDEVTAGRSLADFERVNMGIKMNDFKMCRFNVMLENSTLCSQPKDFGAIHKIYSNRFYHWLHLGFYICCVTKFSIIQSNIFIDVLVEFVFVLFCCFRLWHNNVSNWRDLHCTWVLAFKTKYILLSIIRVE